MNLLSPTFVSTDQALLYRSIWYWFPVTEDSDDDDDDGDGDGGDDDDDDDDDNDNDFCKKITLRGSDSYPAG